MALDKPKKVPKPKHRKGLWSPEEDEKLRSYILRHGGHGSWSSVPIEIGLQRNGKSCRLRWINYLRPGLKRGMFSTDEEEMILALHRDLGNKWSQIAQKLPGRTDNEIKNYWHTHLKKRSARAFSLAPKTLQELIDSWSTSVSSSLSSPSYSSKPLTQVPSLESCHTFQASSACTEPAVHDHDHHTMLSSGLNGFPNDGIQSSLPKLFFEEWLSLDRTNTSNQQLNPSDDQLAASILRGDTFMDNNEFLQHERSSALDFESGQGGNWANDIVSYPDLCLDGSLADGCFNFGVSNDHDVFLFEEDVARRSIYNVHLFTNVLSEITKTIEEL